MHHVAVYIREPVVATLVLKCQLCVLDAQQMHDRGIQIMNVNRVADDIVGIVVGFSVRNSSSDTSA